MAKKNEEELFLHEVYTNTDGCRSRILQGVLLPLHLHAHAGHIPQDLWMVAD